MAENRGRPATYTDETYVCIAPGDKPTRLQRRSQRRAVVDYLLDKNGCATMGQIDEHFGFDVRPTVLALLRNGWLKEGTE